MTARLPLWLLGASGHGREVAAVAREVLRSQSDWVDGFLDDSPASSVHEIGELTVCGPTAMLSESPGRAILGVGYPETKRKIVLRVARHVREWPTIVHPRAILADRIQLGKGCFIQAGAVLTCDIVFGDYATINTGATINHDVIADDYVTISPGARIGGRVSIGEGSFIGIGASVIQGIRIGAWSVIGAGAAVVDDVPDNTVVGGVPARLLKTRPRGWHLE